MDAVEFTKTVSPHRTTKAVQAACIEQGMIILTCGPFGSGHWIPPLVVTEDQINKP
jgi:4-aminobutyrate aminotransferase-like enzyme